MDGTLDGVADELYEASSRWWMFLISGIAWILFAFVILTWELTTVWAIAVFAGITFIAGGVVELATAGVVPSWRWVHVLIGVISIIAGIVAFVWPGQTFLVLAAILAWYLLFAGTIDVVVSFMARHVSELWWLGLIVGIAQVLIGFWAIGYADRSVVLLVVWVAATALARGLSGLFLAFSLHGAAKRIPAAT